MARRFTIADLRTLVARALQQGSYTPAESKRIRAVPDTRTIRYYTTLGLIDGPIEMRGRTAFYSDRHVEQLVAIKRLQGRNLTLSQIQTQLVGASARQLRKFALIPDDFWKAADEYLTGTPTDATPNGDSTTEPAYWAAIPALPSSKKRCQLRLELQSVCVLLWGTTSSC